MPPLREVDPPPSEIERMRGGKGKIIGIGIGLAVLAGGGLAAYFLLGRPKGDSEVTYGALWGCVAGDALTEGEGIEARQRSIAAAMGDDKGDYPARCQRRLDDFYATLGGDPKKDGLREVLDLEINCREKCSIEAFSNKLGKLHEIIVAAGIKPKEIGGDAPKMLSGKPLVAADFRELVPGTVSLQGMTSVGEGRTALLFKDTVGILHVCEIAPDADVAVACNPTRLPVAPQTARLVEGKSAPTIFGVVSMGETPDQTTYGVFDAKRGEATEDDPASVTSATDRPKLPPMNATWFSAPLDGKKVTVARAPNGVLRLDREGDPPRFVMDDGDHGGPGTGNPITFVGSKRAVVLFTAKQGIAALVVKGDGTVEPAK